jgi:predicted MFS family arabinose efflux permease
MSPEMRRAAFEPGRSGKPADKPGDTSLGLGLAISRQLARLSGGDITVSCPPGAGTIFRVLRRRQVPSGMLAVALFFMGQFALFTYLRPFLETVTAVSISTLSLLLLLMGLAGVAGTTIVSHLLQKRLFIVLGAIPLIMAMIAVALIAFGSSSTITAALLIGWGLFSTAAPVGWGTWLSRTMADDAEAGGGLQVAIIQLAITLGASLGGVLFDGYGWWTTFLLAAGLLVGSFLFAIAAWKLSTR